MLDQRTNSQETLLHGRNDDAELIDRQNIAPAMYYLVKYHGVYGLEVEPSSATH